MISGESSAQPSPPLPDTHLVTAQLEGSTLTRAQYSTIHSLICSLLCLPTVVLVYDGHTLNPLTLHWHFPHMGSMFMSSFTCAEMAELGVHKIKAAADIEFKIPHFILHNFIELKLHIWVYP